jgi:hypothetical protein
MVILEIHDVNTNQELKNIEKDRPKRIPNPLGFVPVLLLLEALPLRLWGCSFQR